MPEAVLQAFRDAAGESASIEQLQAANSKTENILFQVVWDGTAFLDFLNGGVTPLRYRCNPLGPLESQRVHIEAFTAVQDQINTRVQHQ